MRYLLLVWVDETAEAAELPLDAVGTWIDDVQGRGLRLIGGPLGPDRVVDRRAGTRRRAARDGRSVRRIPRVDRRIRRRSSAATSTSALRAARRHPMVGLGSIELRPIGSLGVPGEERVLAGVETS